MVCRKRAFTLIEVMVAVMIVSVVISAMLTLRGNSSQRLITLQKEQKNMQYATLLLDNRDQTLESATTNAYGLLNNIETDDVLRRELKNISLHIEYKKEKSLDMDNMTFEIGETILKSKKFQISLQRITQL